MLFNLNASVNNTVGTNPSDPATSSPNGRPRSLREESRDVTEGGRPLLSLKLASLEFP